MLEIIILKGKNYTVKLSSNINEIDYYTDFYIKLYYKDKEIILIKDNILYLKNLIKTYVERIDMFELDYRIDISKIGILYNDYSQFMNNNINKKNIILDENQNWIGQKYIFSIYKNNITWIYKKEENICVKVTSGFWFIKWFYKDIFNVVITMRQLKKLYKILIELCNEANL